jgi:prepilin peptidase CpaA
MSAMSNPAAFVTVAVLAVGLVACGFDIATRRIPNWLTAGAALAAVAFHLYTGGFSGAAFSFGGLLVGLAIFFPIFALGALGGGDVKLMACLGAWLGPVSALWIALYAAIAGGVMAVVISVARGYTGRAFDNIWLLLTHWRVGGIRPLPELTLKESKGPRLAYALPITIGAVMTLWAR